MSLFKTILLFSLLPVLTMISGGIIATIKKPGGNIRSLILHFAAGVVFSVVGVEILPDVIKSHSPLMTIIGFALGFIVMAGVRKLTEGREEKEVVTTEDMIPWGLLTGIGVDIFIDGLLLGIALQPAIQKGYYWRLRYRWNYCHWGWQLL